MKNKIVLDIHTHTIASGHAFGTLRENALAASEKGLLGLGVSDHAPGVPNTANAMYFTNMRILPRELYGVKIYRGCENNVLNDGTMTLSGRDMRALDYNIVGIHGQCYDDQGLEGNTENLIRCMKDEKTFFISHPDDGSWPLDYERIVKAAKECGVALELNNSHIVEPWRKDCLRNMKIYLELCNRYKANIFVGSDAHDPSRIGDFGLALKMLEELDFDEDLIVNTSIEKFEAFIGFGR